MPSAASRSGTPTGGASSSGSTCEADLRRRARRGTPVPAADLTTRVGSVVLPNPVLLASGTAGHGAELAPYLDLASLGAVVVKSLLADPWAGNPAPRVLETPSGMLNSVGLQGPGVAVWLEEELPELLATGARVVASIWGRTVQDYADAAELLAGAPAGVVAVEVNVSCPNVEDRRRMFAHDPESTERAIAATAACGRPRWAKLSPNVTDLVGIAEAAARGGAEAVTLVNTVMGMAIDTTTRRYRLGAGGGGLSGAAMHPVAVRAVHDVRAALPELPIVGVGGVVDGETAAELLLAGASAVQVGTATFADPRAGAHVLAGLARWCDEQGVRHVAEVVGAVHEDRDGPRATVVEADVAPSAPVLPVVGPDDPAGFPTERLRGGEQGRVTQGSGAQGRRDEERR